MKDLLILKLIFRSWWRNKFFVLISLVSLAIGIACTNLLLTYVIYESNIESGNKDLNRMVYMSQDFPFGEGTQVSFIAGDVPSMIKNKYPEVEEYLRIQDIGVFYATAGEGGQVFNDVSLLGVDSTFLSFFPYQVKEGDLSEVLSAPGYVAITERTAMRLFGNDNPVGKPIAFVREWEETLMCRVGAVLKTHHQAFLNFDAITLNSKDFFGGVSLLKLKDGTDSDKLLEKINGNPDIPRLKMEAGMYYFSTLQDAAFSSFPNEALGHIHHVNKEMIIIGLASAILILLIACFNYANLFLSRILQQIKLIRIEKLMGATSRDVRFQLFADTFLTVFIAFLLALLLMHDFLSTFNSIMHSSLDAGFFFHSQVLWVLLAFILILFFVPAFYISRHLSNLSETGYTENYGGRKKRTIISFMVIIQLVISIGLLLASVTVYRQLELAKEGGCNYKNLIGLGGGNLKLPIELKKELERLPEVISATTSTTPAISSGLRELEVTHSDGSKQPWAIEIYDGDTDYLETFSIKQLWGVEIKDVFANYAHPVLVNETFVKTLVPKEVNPIGHFWKEFDEWGDSTGVIAGVVEDFQVLSSDIRIRPAVIVLHPDDDQPYYYLHVKLNETKSAHTLSQIEHVWKRLHIGEAFLWENVHQQYLNRNQSVIDLSNLLLLYVAISISLTYLGLLGITYYSIRQRKREVNIRKINGASSFQILLLLMKPYIRRMSIAFIVAMPVTYWLLSRWLEQFVYRIDITVGMMVLPFLSLSVIILVMVVVYGWRMAFKSSII